MNKKPVFSYRKLSEYRSELMGIAMLSVMAFHMTALRLPPPVNI